jgi:hypothetical protein
VKNRARAANLSHWDWHTRDKSQGSGDRVPRYMFLLLRAHFVHSAHSQIPFFRRMHVSAFNFCMSLFR